MVFRFGKLWAVSTLIVGALLARDGWLTSSSSLLPDTRKQNQRFNLMQILLRKGNSFFWFCMFSNEWRVIELWVYLQEMKTATQLITILACVFIRYTMLEEYMVDMVYYCCCYSQRKHTSFIVRHTPSPALTTF